MEEISDNPNYDFIKKITRFEGDDGNFSDNVNNSIYREFDISTVYIDPDSLVRIGNNKLVIMTFNIQSLPSKFNEFSDLLNIMHLADHLPDIICLQEVWQIDDPDLYDLDHFQPIVTRTRCNNRGGGVGIYVNKKLNYRVMEDLSIFHERIFESISIEVTTSEGKNIIISSIYRPGTPIPGLPFSEQFSLFSNYLANLMANLTEKSDHVYLCGDFNLDILQFNTNKYISDYIDLTFSCGFLQYVTKPTRIQNNCASIIDHILSNDVNDDCVTNILCTSISDHFPLLHYINANNQNLNKNTSHITRNFSNHNINRFKENLASLSWEHVTTLTNAQTAFDSFSDTFNELFNLHFPAVSKKLNRNYHKIEPWMT